LASSPIVREESKNQLRGATDPNPGAVWRLGSRCLLQSSKSTLEEVFD